MLYEVITRLMAQAYTDDLRLESARVSEQFQSFAYGDIGQPMVMPQSLVTALPVLEGARVMSLDETAAMFVDKPYRFSLTGLVGSQETWGTSVMASARSVITSYSIHYTKLYDFGEISAFSFPGLDSGSGHHGSGIDDRRFDSGGALEQSQCGNRGSDQRNRSLPG